MAKSDFEDVPLGTAGALELGAEQIGAALDADAAPLTKVRRRCLVPRVVTS